MADRIDVVQLVREGKARYGWHWITSTVGELRLRIAVMRDAMRFDAMPQLDWFRRVKSRAETYDGVRLPASAHELQQIADLVGGSLMTPRVVDLIWLQADTRFDAIINDGPPDFNIAAEMDITELHQMIEAKIAEAGGDEGGGLISCVGKYWVLVNELLHKGMVDGDWAACNYGWCSSRGSGPGLTPGVRCWQRPGYKHNKQQVDPSQSIRLVHQQAELSRDSEQSWSEIQLVEVFDDPELAKLVTHDGERLSYTRQRGVEPLDMGGHVVLPPVTIRICGKELTTAQ